MLRQKNLSELYSAFNSFKLDQIIEIRRVQLADELVWARVRVRGSNDAGNVAEGLCLNILVFRPEDLLPELVRFHAAGTRRLLEDEKLQAEMAHAYWQARWAGGALRERAGETEPVAFAAVDRGFPEKRNEPRPEITQVGPKTWVVGEQEILLYRLRKLSDRRALYFRHRFVGPGLTRAESAWLERHAFLDRYIGDHEGKERPEDPVRLIFISGAHTISRLARGEGKYFFQTAARGNFRFEAAANSTFFLNFPEEYRSVWSAMNDPAAFLMARGRLMQLPLVRRGALLISKEGTASIRPVSLRHFSFRLPWENSDRRLESGAPFEINNSDAVEDAIVVFTPAFKAGSPPESQKTPEGKVVDYVVVFGRIVEICEGGGTEIPANGLVISQPRDQLAAAPIELIRSFGRIVRFTLLPESLGMKSVVTALAAGPLLLRGGKLIRTDYFSRPGADEEFAPAVFEDGRMLQTGMVPTRFPHVVENVRAPRTVVGTHRDGHLILAVIDGRQPDHSIGATLREAARLMLQLGCSDALNLDGGGSSMLYLAEKAAAGAPLQDGVTAGVVNLPSDVGWQERLMPVVLLIGNHRNAGH